MTTEPVTAAEIGDPEEALKVHTDVIDRLAEDQETRVMLHWIVEDERTTIRWVKESCARLNPAWPTWPRGGLVREPRKAVYDPTRVKMAHPFTHVGNDNRLRHLQIPVRNSLDALMMGEAA